MLLGIEIGGTKLQLGIGPGDGTLRALWRGTVDVAAGPEGIRRQITAAVPELLTQARLERSELRGVGIGFGGPVDDATRTIIKSNQIAGWDGFPLADWISDLVGVPGLLANDADAAGLAEGLFGAGKWLSPIFYITIGSGIGGGFIVDGEIYRGHGRGAAEIGHLRVLQHSLTGSHVTTVEDSASGWAIERQARLLALESEFHKELLQLAGGRVEKLTARLVAEAAEAGYAGAKGILHQAWIPLAEGICQVIALLAPRRIIIGGGVSNMGEKVLFGPLRQLVAERVFQPFAGSYDIVRAALGEEVVVHGALALARQRLGNY